MGDNQITCFCVLFKLPQTLLQEYAAMSQQEAQDTVNKMKVTWTCHIIWVLIMTEG